MAQPQTNEEDPLHEKLEEIVRSAKATSARATGLAGSSLGKTKWS